MDTSSGRSSVYATELTSPVCRRHDGRAPLGPRDQVLLSRVPLISITRPAAFDTPGRRAHRKGVLIGSIPEGATAGRLAGSLCAWRAPLLHQHDRRLGMPTSTAGPGSAGPA